MKAGSSESRVGMITSSGALGVDVAQPLAKGVDALARVGDQEPAVEADVRAQ